MSAALLDIEPPCLKTAASDEALKQELLSAHMPSSDSKDHPRKGTKNYIISQIEHLCGTAGIPITETNRELSRQSKAQLKGTLAYYMEKASLRRLKAQQTIASPPLQDASPNLQANVFILRMLHDTVLGGLEKVYESYGKPYSGYTISGLSAKLQEDPLTSQVDSILAQIAEESPELLDYFESPYAKLALCWIMAAVQVARKETDKKPNDSRRDRNIPQKPGNGTPTLVRGPEAIDGGKRVQFTDLRSKKGGEKLSDKPAADKTGRAGASGPGDSGLRRVRPLLSTDDQILRPSILLQGVASRTL